MPSALSWRWVVWRLKTMNYSDKLGYTDVLRTYLFFFSFCFTANFASPKGLRRPAA